MPETADLFDWQTALYATLNGDAVLLSKVTAVFDHVPQDTKAPYLTIGTMEGDDYSTHSRNGMELMTHIRIFTVEKKGNKQALDILREVDRLLCNKTGIVVSNICFIAAYKGRVNVVPGIDGLNRQTIARYRVQLLSSTERTVI